MHRVISHLSLILFLTLFNGVSPLLADEDALVHKPFVFAVIGDSIARGVWADTSIGHPNRRFYADIIHAQLLRSYFAATMRFRHPKGDPRDIFTNSLTFIQRDYLSAIVGNQDYSLPVRLKNKLGRKVIVMNNALLAGSYVDGYRQLDALDAKVKKSRRQPDLIIVHINAVDFVREYTTRQFTQKAHAFFNRLATSYPHSAIVVTQLVDVVALVTRPNVPSYRLPNSNRVITCGDMYEQTKFGTLIGLRPGASAALIAKGYERLNTMRSVLRDETAKMQNGEGVYQNFTGKVLLIEDAEAPTDGNFNSILAVDCIHPNAAGQQQLSKVIWDRMVDAEIVTQ